MPQPHTGELVPSGQQLWTFDASGNLILAGNAYAGGVPDPTKRGPGQPLVPGRQLALAPPAPQSLGTLLSPSGDTSGVQDTGNIQGILNLGLPVELSAGTFYITSVQMNTNALAQLSITGQGPATLVYVVGNGPGIYLHRASGYGAQYGLPAQQTCGYLKYFTVDGTFAGASAIGVDAGDGWGYEMDLVIVNFTGASAMGLHLDNAVFWTEKCWFRASLMNNTTACVIDASAGAQSHEYTTFEFHLFLNAGQNGVVLKNGAYFGGDTLRLRGNVGSSNTSGVVAGTAALTLTGSGGGFNSHIAYSFLDIKMEAGQGNTFGPMTVNCGAASNTIQNCYGQMQFTGTPWTASNMTGTFSFIGYLLDATLQTRAVNTVPWMAPTVPAPPAGFSPANPATTVSTTEVMMGLGATCAFTPAGSGNVLVVVTGVTGTSTASTQVTLGGRYGTGTAPVNGAAVTGTRFGGVGDQVIQPSTAVAGVGFALTGMLALTPGTAYWFDLALATASAADAAKVQQVAVSLIELP